MRWRTRGSSWEIPWQLGETQSSSFVKQTLGLAHIKHIVSLQFETWWRKWQAEHRRGDNNRSEVPWNSSNARPRFLSWYEHKGKTWHSVGSAGPPKCTVFKKPKSIIIYQTDCMCDVILRMCGCMYMCVYVCLTFVCLTSLFVYLFVCPPGWPFYTWGSWPVLHHTWMRVRPSGSTVQCACEQVCLCVCRIWNARK